MMSTVPRTVSVIIPAHNEEGVIGPCLRSIIDQENVGPLRIIVVPNGCADRTAEVADTFRQPAASMGHELLVANISQRGKPAALNAGDGLAGEGIRVYMDGDGVLSANAIAAVCRLLRPGNGIHLAAPRLTVAPMRSWVTRRYVSVWLALRELRGQFSGCGFLAISAEGRRRWGSFPDIIGDDHFITLHFVDRERATADDASVLVRMPEGLRETVLVRSRRVRGNLQVRQRFPELLADRPRRRGAIMGLLLRHPRRVGDLAIYLVINALGRILAWRNRKAGVSLWERADASRVGAVSPPGH